MKLYRYEKVEFALQSAKGKYIYLSSPSGFNDAYDSSIGFDIEIFEDFFVASFMQEFSNKFLDPLGISLETLSKKYLPNSDFDINDRVKLMSFIGNLKLSDEFDFLKSFNIENFDSNIDHIFKSARSITGVEPNQSDLKLVEHLKKNDLSDSLLNEELKKNSNDLLRILKSDNLRIGCLTEKKDSHYMWALYADSFKGACFEYDYELLKEELPNKIHKVDYNHKRPILSFEKVAEYMSKSGNDLKKELDDDLLKILTSKNPVFENENEWRIISSESREYHYTKSIKAIYLGLNMTNETLIKFKDCTLGTNIKLYRLKKSFNDYSISFELVQ